MRSGKGTIARVLTALVGAANACAPTLHNLGTHFGLEGLIAKQLAVVSDARLSKKSDPAAVAENLLRISGEDSVSVPRKFRSDFAGRLLVRFVLLSNELPAIADASGAIASRYVMMCLTKSFYGREDPLLFETLRAGVSPASSIGRLMVSRDSRNAGISCSRSLAPTSSSSSAHWRPRLRPLSRIGAR